VLQSPVMESQDQSADDYDYAACRHLVCALLLRAARDVQAHRPCNGQCEDVHVCAGAARAWLASAEAAALAALIEIRLDLSRLSADISQPDSLHALAAVLLDDPDATNRELRERLGLKASTICGLRRRLRSQPEILLGEGTAKSLA
jgi:hypothetical protein